MQARSISSVADSCKLGGSRKFKVPMVLSELSPVFLALDREDKSPSKSAKSSHTVRIDASLALEEWPKSTVAIIPRLGQA
jgi:hypothetical protein